MRLSDFILGDSGAVTVDWVVLTAAVVGLGVTTVAAVRTGVISLGGDIDSSLSAASVAALSTLGDAGPAAAGFVYQLLYLTDAQFVTTMAGYSGLPDATLLGLYTGYLGHVEQYLLDGGLSSAAYNTDVVYGIQQLLIERGVEVPDGGAGLMDVYNRQI